MRDAEGTRTPIPRERLRFNCVSHPQKTRGFFVAEFISLRARLPECNETKVNEPPRHRDTEKTRSKESRSCPLFLVVSVPLCLCGSRLRRLLMPEEEFLGIEKRPLDVFPGFPLVGVLGDVA